MAERPEAVRVAAAQAASVFLDREATVDKACRLIEEAGAHGATLVAFPEGFIPAHPIWFHFHPVLSPKAQDLGAMLFDNAVEVPSAATAALCDSARKAGTYVVMGICERRPRTTGTLFNTLLFIDETGRLAGRHRKLMPTIGERLVHTGGSAEGLRAYPSPFGSVSGLICGENSNPLAVFALAAESTSVHVASWPPMFHETPGPMQHVVELASRSFAYTTKAFVVSSCGTLDDRTLEIVGARPEDTAYLSEPGQVGGSLVASPDGRILAGPLGAEEDVLYADLALESTVKAKLVQDFAGHYNRPDVFRLHVNVTPHEVMARETPPASVSAGARGREIPGDAGGSPASPAEPPSLTRGAEEDRRGG